jgi:hypothetical protein
MLVLDTLKGLFLNWISNKLVLSHSKGMATSEHEVGMAILLDNIL